MCVLPNEFAARVTSTMITFIRSGSWLVAVDDERGDRRRASRAPASARRRPRGSARASRSSARGTACRAPRPWRRSSGRRGRRRRPPHRRCRDTRQAWKPWRANTRTAASRISRRLSAAALAREADGRPAELIAVPPRGRLGPAVGAGRRLASEGRLRADLAAGARGRARPRARGTRSSPACASTTPHGSTIIERPPECCPRRMLAELVGGDHERLVLDRARAQSVSQWSRVVASVNAAGHRDASVRRARRGSGRARGSAGRNRCDSPRLDAVGGLREHDLLARPARARTRGRRARRPRRRTCAPCGRSRGSRRRRSMWTRVLASFSWPSTSSRIEPATISTPQLARVARAQRDRRAVERLGRGAQLLARCPSRSTSRGVRSAARRPRPPRGSGGRPTARFAA